MKNDDVDGVFDDFGDKVNDKKETHHFKKELSPEEEIKRKYREEIGRIYEEMNRRGLFDSSIRRDEFTRAEMEMNARRLIRKRQYDRTVEDLIAQKQRLVAKH